MMIDGRKTEAFREAARAGAESRVRTKPKWSTPPPTESPGSMSVERGAKQDNRSQLRARNTRTRSKRQVAKSADLAIYCGQIWLGTVRQTTRGFAAIAIDDREIGVFPTLKAAADAVDTTYRGER